MGGAVGFISSREQWLIPGWSETHKVSLGLVVAPESKEGVPVGNPQGPHEGAPLLSCAHQKCLLALPNAPGGTTAHHEESPC